GTGWRYRTSGEHALRRDTVTARVRAGVGAAAGDDAALPVDRGSRAESERERWLRRHLYGSAAAPDRRDRLRICRRLSAYCAEWNAGPRLREQGTNGRTGEDGHAKRRFARSAGRSNRVPGRVMGSRFAER